MTKPLLMASSDQDILDTVAEGGPNFIESQYFPTITKVLTALARSVKAVQDSIGPRSVPISERAMNANSWEDLEKLNDRDFLVQLARRGATGYYYDFGLFMAKFGPIIARSLLTNTVQAQEYPDDRATCSCGRTSFHDTSKCQGEGESPPSTRWEGVTNQDILRQIKVTASNLLSMSDPHLVYRETVYIKDLASNLQRELRPSRGKSE